MNKVQKVQDKVTGVISNVQYGANRLGNMRMWVDGVFYSDKNFDKKFKILTDN